MLSFLAQRVASQSIDATTLKMGNLVIHMLCGGLVYLLSRLVLMRAGSDLAHERAPQAALLAAALWLLAPLHVSTVLYVVQRMAQLSTLFTLAGLVLYMLRREQWAREAASPGGILATVLWLLLIVFLAVFSKENGILLLWLLAVLEVTLYRGLWAGAYSRTAHLLGMLALVAPLILCFLILLLAPEMLLSGYLRREFSLEERLLTQSRLLWQYLYWLLVPDINQMGFQHDDIELSRSLLSPLTTLLSLLGWGAALILGWLLRAKHPLLLFAILFYLLSHSMESSLWPLEMVYEHRNYLPSVGVFIAVAYYSWRLFERMSHILRPVIPAFAVLATCGTLLFLRVHAWADPVRMNVINVNNHSESPRSHFFLAEALLNKYSAEQKAGTSGVTELSKYLVLARHHLERMYQLNPRDVAGLVMLYYMDSYHTTELQATRDWYAELLELLKTRRLQASDISALDTLLNCIANEYCPATEAQVSQLFAVLEDRYPNNSKFELLHYRYLEARDLEVAQHALFLHEVERAEPGNTLVYQLQIKLHHQAGNTSEVFEAVREWLHYDQKRRELTRIRRLFHQPEPDDDLISQDVTPDV